MAGFNTLPTKTVSAAAATTTGTGVNLIPPILNRTPLGDAAFAEGRTSNRHRGFLGNGDYVETPATVGDTLEYYNNAGVLQWSIANTQLNAAVDNWVGFHADLTDLLIYAIGVDETTTTDTFYLVSINTAGTITNIGAGAQPGVDFGQTGTNWWAQSATSTGSSLIQRAADGSGNIFVRQSNTGLGFQEMEVNITTGAIVSDPAVIDINMKFVPWKTQKGQYWAVTAATLQGFLSATTGFIGISIADPQNFGWSNGSTAKSCSWFGRHEHFVVNTTTLQTSAGFISSSIEVIETWIDSVLTTYGID